MYMDIKLSEMIKRHLNKHMETELRYPNRFKEIHKVPCINCPSVYNKNNGVIDPEFEDIKNLDREEHLASVFVCGWRGSKLCKGYCDELNITESDLNKRVINI